MVQPHGGELVGCARDRLLRARELRSLALDHRQQRLGLRAVEVILADVAALETVHACGKGVAVGFGVA